MSDTLTELVRASTAAATATERRDDLIRKARDEGHSLRRVANAAGVSHETVANIVRRHAARS